MTKSWSLEKWTYFTVHPFVKISYFWCSRSGWQSSFTPLLGTHLSVFVSCCKKWKGRGRRKKEWSKEKRVRSSHCEIILLCFPGNTKVVFFFFPLVKGSFKILAISVNIVAQIHVAMWLTGLRSQAWRALPLWVAVSGPSLIPGKSATEEREELRWKLNVLGLCS